MLCLFLFFSSSLYLDVDGAFGGFDGDDDEVVEEDFEDDDDVLLLLLLVRSFLPASITLAAPAKHK